MRHSLCLRMAHLICLSSVVIALWSCTTHTSQTGNPGRRTLADLFQSHNPGTPTAHPDTPTDTDKDWQLWTTIKARWPEVEKMLADRQALLSAPTGTLENTQKKTYVFDVRHIALIDAYAQAHRLEPKDVIYAMCQEFFERREFLPQGRRTP
jgi:hypothetical protein